MTGRGKDTIMADIKDAEMDFFFYSSKGKGPLFLTLSSAKKNGSE